MISFSILSKASGRTSAATGAATSFLCLECQLKNASPTVRGAFISASVSRHPQGREALEHGNALVTESMWRGEPGVAVEGMRVRVHVTSALEKRRSEAPKSQSSCTGKRQPLGRAGSGGGGGAGCSVRARSRARSALREAESAHTSAGGRSRQSSANLARPASAGLRGRTGRGSGVHSRLFLRCPRPMWTLKAALHMH